MQKKLGNKLIILERAVYLRFLWGKSQILITMDNNNRAREDTAIEKMHQRLQHTSEWFLWQQRGGRREIRKDFVRLGRWKKLNLIVIYLPKKKSKYANGEGSALAGSSFNRFPWLCISSVLLFECTQLIIKIIKNTMQLWGVVAHWLIHRLSSKGSRVWIQL